MRASRRFITAVFTLAMAAGGCGAPDQGNQVGDGGTAPGGGSATGGGIAAGGGTAADGGTPKSFSIYTVGDSTMAYYDPAAFPNQRGWGQVLPQFVTSSAVTVVDAAKNGRSSKSFYEEGSWAAVKNKLLPGDYVLIQFAHNDEKVNGLDDLDGGVGTAPFGGFQTYLRKYVDETVAAGATPVLVTPIVRRYFSGATITAKGCHDLTGVGDPSIPVTQDLNYVEAMKQVATEKSCLSVDMTASTKQLVESYGATTSKSVIYVSTDDTHVQPLGATLFAQLAVQEMVNKGILADVLNPAADLVVSPSSLGFGDVFLGVTVDKVVSVTGLSLAPDTGNVTVTAPDGFSVGGAGGTFASTLQVPYSGGRLAPTNVTVRFAPDAGAAYSGTVSFAPGPGAAKTVSVSGTGVPVPAGGTEAVATYALTGDTSCTPTGFVTCAAETLSGLYVKSYAVPAASTTWVPAPPASTTTQRVSIIGDTWPGSEIDVVASRYVQFAVSPAVGHSFAVDRIRLWAGPAGSNNIGYRIQYSTSADFSGTVTLLDSPANTSNTIVQQSFAPAVTVSDGSTLYVRIFPWLKGSAAATGKYLCLQSLELHGTAY